MKISRKYILGTFIFAFGIGAGAMTLINGKLWSEKSPVELKNSSVDAEALNRPFVNLADTMKPTVVNIYTKTRIGGGRRNPYGDGAAPDDLFRFFFGNPFGGDMGAPPAREAQALGSGFVINPDGLIVTNSHVVRMSGRNADSIMVKFVSDSPRAAGDEATVLGVDENTDVAVIKLKKKRPDLKVAPLGDSAKLKVGEWVVAIGNPYGHTNSVTKGIVSALGRSLDELDKADFIQTDASINPGNSGGPLFNLVGEVIGINTAVDARAQGIGFAIPINTAKSVIKQIIEKGEVETGWIGVGLADLRPEIARSLGMPNADGALIQEVVPGAPAARAGLRSYDVIVDIDGKKITSARDLSLAVRGAAVGATLTAKYLRDGKPGQAKILITKRQSESSLSASPAPRKGPSRLAQKTGLYLTELTSDDRRQMRLHPSLRGVLVQGVMPGSLAQEAGLQANDVITEINRVPSPNLATAEKLLAHKGNAFLLKVQRRTASMIILLDLSQEAAEGDE